MHGNMLKKRHVPETAWHRKTWGHVGGDREWDWKKKRKVAAVTLETVNSSVGLNAAIVRAEMGHSATAESKKQINPSSWNRLINDVCSSAMPEAKHWATHNVAQPSSNITDLASTSCTHAEHKMSILNLKNELESS